MAGRWFRSAAARRARSDGRERTRAVLRGCRRSGGFGDRIALWVATAGGLGFLPRGGVFGSFAGAVLGALLAPTGCTWAGVGAAAAAGIVATSRVQRACGVSDPGEVCVDEVAGAWLAVAVAGATGWACAIPLACFGAFDFLKPWPANRLDAWHGGTGVVGDDLVAGLYAGLAARAVAWLAAAAGG